jgi:16S rRNA (guanine(966)-N(2))-methyltransferase RsmD
VRPTTDFAKNGLFNVLQNRVDFESLSVLDLFSGAGGVSMEFLSRGVNDLIAVDNDIRCSKFLKEVFLSYKLDNARTVKSDALAFIERCTIPFDIVFADPPYAFPKTKLIPDLVFNKNLIKPGGKLILEHGRSNSFEAHPLFTEQRVYGEVRFSIFEPSPITVAP